MPKLVNRVPVVRLHKRSGHARVRIDGKEHFLGRFGSPEAKAAYDRLVSEWLSRGRSLTTTSGPAEPVSSLTVAECLLRYWQHVRIHYRESREQDNLKDALRPSSRRGRSGPCTSGNIEMVWFGPGWHDRRSTRG
jgi:hypothetical protein